MIHPPKIHPQKHRPRPTRPRHRILLLLLPLLFLFLFRHYPSPHNPQPTLPTLPIHQICLNSCPTFPTTANVQSFIVLPSTSILPHIRTLPNQTLIYLTSSCITASPNTMELLYLAFYHHQPSALVPYVTGHTLDAILPLLTTPSAFHGATLEQALNNLLPNILEIPSTTAKSSCNHHSQPINRHHITIRSSKRLPKTLLLTGEEAIPTPFKRVPFTSPITKPPVVLFVMPWLQMGGSEQCMLRLAEYAITKRYIPAFMVLQPFFGETDGRLVTRNDWMSRAYALTAHVYDVVNLAPYHRRAELIRYVFDVHAPKYVITANSRLFYNLLPMVRLLLPRAVIGDYSHMVHQDWLGGGMPRYAANNTRFIDRHFTASGNVTSAIRGWVASERVDTQKVHTCYIGADVKPFHRGIRKHFIRRVTRAGMGIGNDKILVLFAGRFVLDKGVDVLVEVMTRLKDSRYAFLLVGSGGMETLIQPLQESGRVVIRPGASDTEMAEYYAASDVLLLPSVKEGIALVLYEAMANGLLVITTDVGGQKELVTPDRGVLLKRGPTLQVALKVVDVLVDIPTRPGYYSRLGRAGERVVRERFTTERFAECVFSGMKSVQRTGKEDVGSVGSVEEVQELVRRTLKVDRRHCDWALRVFPMSVSGALTVVQTGSGGGESGMSGLKQRYANLSVVKKKRISEASDVDTEAALIVPQGYDISKTDLQAVVNVLRRPIGRVIFDVVGMRINGVNVGRLRFSDNGTQHCVIREDVFEGGSEKGLKSIDAANVVEIHDVYRVDVVGQVFVVRTESLRKVLKEGKLSDGFQGGELFRVAKKEGWNVGYVYDVVVEGHGEMVKVEGAGDGGVCDTAREHLLF